MKTRSLSILAGLALAGALSVCAAQGTGEGRERERGSVPSGTERSGSGPADGAIIGGSLEPEPGRDVKRCKELGGKLREECLRDLRRQEARAPAAERKIIEGSVARQ